MRRILFVGYHYPPVGGGGVQRNRRFVQHLPEFGYAPVVITGTGAQDGRWTPSDPTIADEPPPGVEIHRARGPEAAPASGVRLKADTLLDRPDPLARWWVESATRMGVQLGADCDAIVVSLIPYESAEIGARLAAQLGKPWIADLQDPWVLDEMWLYPSRIHRARDGRRMRALLGTAAAIVMNTPEAAKRVREAFPELAARIVVSITNGFDAADFAGPAPVRDDTAFRIVHTGTMHTATGMRLRRRRVARRVLGGVTPGIDFLPRSHIYLLEALDRLVADDPALSANLEVHLAGVLTATDREVAERSPYVRLLGYRSHEETIGLIRSADLLFLPMHDLPPGQPAGLVPGKAYEYLASGRPILAAVPDGDVREILQAVGTARICRPADVDDMTEQLRAAIDAWRTAAEPPIADAAEVARYERRELTGQLGDVVDKVLGVRRARPVPAPRTAPVAVSARNSR